MSKSKTSSKVTKASAKHSKTAKPFLAGSERSGNAAKSRKLNYQANSVKKSHSDSDSDSNSDSNSDSEAAVDSELEESANSDEEDISSMDENDEFDDDEFDESGDEDLESESETEAGDAKKAKLNDGSDFDAALSSILNSKIKAYNAENPVLIRDQRSAKRIQQDKEDAKARKAIRADKLKNQDKARVKNVVPLDTDEAGRVLQNEKILRKIAQRGVVRLLNAIHSAQSVAITGDVKDTEVSKEKFLDMIRMG